MSDLLKDKASLFTTGTVDDPDVAEITVIARLKSGRPVKGLDSLTLERALLKFVGSNVIPYAKHCRDAGVKELR